MKKITLLLAFVALTFTTASALSLPLSGTLSPSVPAGWVYVSNDPTGYPNPTFYTTVPGLKLNFENMGIFSPVFDAVSGVKVTLNVAQLNENTKTGISADYFTISALNATDQVVGTATLKSVIVGSNNVEVFGTGIVKIKVIMTGYPNNGSKFCNVNLATISLESKAAGLSNLTASKLEVVVSGKNLFVKNVVEGSPVEIFSALGSKIQTSNVENGKISIANLKNGIYVVRSGKLTQKIML